MTEESPDFEIYRLGCENVELKHKITQLEGECLKWKWATENLGERATHLRGEADRLKKENTELKNKVKKNGLGYNKMANEAFEKSLEIYELKKERDCYVGSLVHWKERLAELKEINVKLKKERDELREMSYSESNKVAYLRVEIEKLKKERDAFKDKMQEMADERLTGLTPRSNACSENDKLAFTELCNKYDQIVRDLGEKNEAIEELRRFNDRLWDDLKKSCAEHRRLELNFEKIEEIIQSERERVERIAQEEEGE